MADVTVRAGDELDVVTLCGPLGGGSTGADFAVVRVRPKDDDAQLAVPEGRLALRTLRLQTNRHKRGQRGRREIKK
jgi:hypothetical protein